MQGIFHFVLFAYGANDIARATKKRADDRFYRDFISMVLVIFELFSLWLSEIFIAMHFLRVLILACHIVEVPIHGIFPCLTIHRRFFPPFCFDLRGNFYMLNIY